MTFTEVFQDLMDGNPVARFAWIEEDEIRIIYYDTEAKSFVDRRGSEEWQSKYICVTGDDLNATDWQIFDWDEDEDEV